MGLSVLLLGALLSPLMILLSCEGCERFPELIILLGTPSSGLGEVIRHVQSPLRTEAGVFFLNASSCLHLSKSSPLLPFLDLLLSSSPFCIRHSGHSVFWKQGGEGGLGFSGSTSTLEGLTQALRYLVVLQPSWGLSCRQGWFNRTGSGALAEQKEK